MAVCASEPDVDFTAHAVTRNTLVAVSVRQEAAACGHCGDVVFEGCDPLLQSKLGGVKLTLQTGQTSLKIGLSSVIAMIVINVNQQQK